MLQLFVSAIFISLTAALNRTATATKILKIEPENKLQQTAGTSWV
jgi:hypothetical protein